MGLGEGFGLGLMLATLMVMGRFVCDDKKMQAEGPPVWVPELMKKSNHEVSP